MGKFQYILLASVLIAVALAAPKEDSDTTEVESKKAEKKSSTDERSVDVVNEDWGNYLITNYSTIGLLGVAILCILGGASYGIYHFYYLPYYGGLNTSLAGDQYGQPHAYQAGYPYAGGQQQYGAYTGRALGTSDPWNFTKVLEYIEIAQKTYEGFDWQDLDCQKRTLCELVQQNENGETGRKLAHSYVYRFMDALDGVPIPKMIQNYLKQYKEAIDQGKVQPAVDCGKTFKCKFSIKEVWTKAATKKKAY
jgi:hypothetical protein